jgi:hypothetical protein
MGVILVRRVACSDVIYMYVYIYIHIYPEV